jgi:hypothetical protein
VGQKDEQGVTVLPPTRPSVPGFPTGIRRAWLVLNGNALDLDNPGAGWACDSLDFGSPAIRTVTTPQPDRDGVYDRTKFYGSRVVSASIKTVRSMGAASIDEVAASFAPFMVPSARPELHYTLDRPDLGSPERYLTLRGAAYAFPIVGTVERDIQLQWEAADPIAYDPASYAISAHSGSPGSTGRTYALTFPRHYPAGTASPTNGTLASPGDVAARPVIQVWGPIEGADVALAWQVAGITRHVAFVSNYIIDAGHYVAVDGQHKTAYLDGDPTQNVIGQLDWSVTTWPYLPPLPEWLVMSLSGASTSVLTQAIAIWADGYLT